MPMMYARAVCRQGRWIGEPLADHLANVGKVAAELAQCLVGRLAESGEGAQAPQDVREILKDADRAAELAGFLHDVGKALFQWPLRSCDRGCPATEGCVEEEKDLSFRLHEAVGAAIAKLAAPEHPILYDVVRPVYLHHQGLRGVDVRRSQPLPRHFADDKILGNSLRQLYDELKGRELPQEFGAAMEFAIDRPRRLAEYLKQFNPIGLLEVGPCDIDVSDRRMLERLCRYRARILTAVLMMADNYVAQRAAEALCENHEDFCKREKSKYVEDINKYMKNCI